ncbi:branched-chain amino acid ABC transporter permease [Natronomonas gomsonensis]|uniref:branched-chain amino acid ABC transporter permease n=1 Tax=Natronomonas gomsonensis TaxID=1046043 RepID=UPI0020CA7AB5|nr:branched-chain amino acid ABC transporter permease [Natronomonas gomsonensis]MCY4729890.1 branched-chain amino acid ABC transporter permease [Natronomonas gomsonensis]
MVSADVVNFLDITISGIGLGALYALVAMGFALIYKVTGVLNFAQGELALVGAYGVVILGTSSLISTPLPAVAAVGATILFGIILGILLERVIFRQFIGEPVLSVIIVTLALGGIFSGFIRFLLGPNYRSYPEALTFGFSIDLPLGTSISAAYALAVSLALVVVIALMLFFRYTVTGSILRAAASDEQAAMVLGVSIERTIALAWALSIGITAIGGVLLAMSSGGAGFSIVATGIIIFAAVVFGGLDSIPGAFIGAIIVGLLQELGSFYLEGGSAITAPIIDVKLNFGAGFGEILPLIFLLVVIVVKPYGLFGTERIERL